MRRIAFALAFALLAAGNAESGTAGGARALYAVDVSHADEATVSAIESSPRIGWWVELGDVLVVEASSRGLSTVAAALPFRRLDGPRAGEALYVGHHVHPNEVAISRPAGCETRLLASSGVYSLIAATAEGAAALDAHEPGSMSPATPRAVYARVAMDRDAHVSKTRDASVAADAIDADRWHATVADLANFRTRFTGTAGANAARDYIANQFTALGLSVEEPRFDGGSGVGYDVVAEIPGTSRVDDVYIVCAHYDSISEIPGSLAPGAEDNGSGAAGVIELARVFSANPPAATVRFITFSGEEEGLYGSKFYVDRLATAGSLRASRA